ncbi:hypothetical protein CC80DRAFT_100988 [Byssothecium circinans]|uniref:Uncharacterized protein n=1 Tax=Byssothecium circinans TaxID=147558 RepID=A0A6A5UJ34_9PLEO|nr:hypothetical protein CC80DRAFT_100988 [Byssothecium circinans]
MEFLLPVANEHTPTDVTKNVFPSRRNAELSHGNSRLLRCHLSPSTGYQAGIGCHEQQKVSSAFHCAEISTLNHCEDSDSMSFIGCSRCTPSKRPKNVFFPIIDENLSLLQHSARFRRWPWTYPCGSMRFGPYLRNARRGKIMAGAICWQPRD